MSCGIGCRQGSDPAVLWFCRRPAAKVLIRPLAWESPYASESSPRKGKRTKKKKKKLAIKRKMRVNECISDMWFSRTYS